MSGKKEDMMAKLSRRSAARKAELEKAEDQIRDSAPESAPIFGSAGDVEKAEEEREQPVVSASDHQNTEDDSIIYEKKRGRKAKYQASDPRRVLSVAFPESAYRKLRRYAFEHEKSISDVLLEYVNSLDD